MLSLVFSIYLFWGGIYINTFLPISQEAISKHVLVNIVIYFSFLHIWQWQFYFSLKFFN